MILTVQPKMKISQLQEEFNRTFPFLKLEFFRHSHKALTGSAKHDLIRLTDTIKITPTKKSIGEISITENMTVIELEQLVSEHFGLSAQVFRKSGKSWLETTVTDDWTLKHQNDQGYELSQLRGS
jgi:hypothetical protein